MIEHTEMLQPGMLLLARPGMNDRFHWDTAQPSSHAFVHFMIDDGDVLGASRRWPLVRQLSAADPLAALCRYLLWLTRADPGRARTRTADVLGWLLDVYVNGPVAEEGEAALPEHLERIVEHLRVAWRDGRTRGMGLDEMATAAGISRGHLARVFRNRFSVGPVAAVELIRLGRAAILLQRSNLTVGQVAETCGFANPFHFSRRFQRVYELSPRTYRSQRPPGDPLHRVSRAGLLQVAHRLLVEDI